jgi:predicted DNA-binding protein (MmcQ/YjbR family)
VARTPAKTTSRIGAICLALPETEEQPFGGHTSPAYRVRGKMFVVISEDRTTMTLKAPEGVQTVLIASDPERFFFPKYVGSKGWVGVRLDLAAAPDWDEIAELIYDSYTLIAPKRLVAQWEDSRNG